MYLVVHHLDPILNWIAVANMNGQLQISWKQTSVLMRC